MKPEINQRVTRIAAETDYTNGRQGTVVEINENTERARVYWDTEKDGRKMTGPKRTWVKFSALK